MELKIIDLPTFKNISKPNKEFLNKANKINKEYSGSNVESFQKTLANCKLFLPLQVSESNVNGEIPTFIRAKENGINEKYTVVFTSYEEFEKFHNKYNLNKYKILITNYINMNNIIKLAEISGYIIDLFGSEIYIYHANI